MWVVETQGWTYKIAQNKTKHHLNIIATIREIFSLNIKKQTSGKC